MRARIHQFHSGSALGDAVTNSLFFVQDLLTKAEVPSDIYVEYRDPRLADRLRLIGEMDPEPDDLLIIHHSFGHDIMPVIEAARCRKVLVYHNITPPEFFPLTSPFHRYALLGYEQLAHLRKMVEGTIADSEFNAEELLRRGFSNVEAISLLGDFKAARTAPYTKQLQYFEEPCYQLLFVGRIAPNKGQLDLVRLVVEYADSFDYPLRLALVGAFDFGGVYLEQIRNQISRSGMADRIQLTGHISDADLYGWYRAADVYVSLSEHEGFGVPMVEAMAFDLPVVAFDSSAIRSTLGGSGILVGDRSPESVVRALRPVLEDREVRRKVLRGQRQRLRAFDVGVCAANLYRFIKPFVSSDVKDRLEDAGSILEAASNVSPKREYIVEGPCETSYSLALVNRALAASLDCAADTSAALVPLEGMPEYCFDQRAAADHPELSELIRTPSLEGGTVISVRNMYPPRPAGMLGDVHLMNFFWEETAVPPRIVGLMNRYLDGMTVASQFGRAILRNSGVRIPIGLIGCGVDHLKPLENAPTLPKRGAKPLVFLHISSGLARKGIEELLTAYASVFTAADQVLLVIKTYENQSNVVRQLVEKLIDGRRAAPPVEVLTETLSDLDMLDLFEMSDVVVLPTRGEGFNLPAAEAFALRKPVVVTNFSAHLEFCTPENAWLLDYDFERSASHLRSLSSLWARPRVSELGRVLRNFYTGGTEWRQAVSARVERAAEAARILTWDSVAERMNMFADNIVAARHRKFGLRVAWVSTWNSRCGIAAYSDFLLSALPTDTFQFRIFADHSEPIQPDGENVSRIWTDTSDSLASLLEAIRSGGYDVAVFQFNFGFFDIMRLGALVRELQEDDDVDCYVFFHATRDAEIGGRNVSIGEATRDLALACRLIVHSVEDVNRLKSFGLIENVVMISQGVYEPKNTVSPELAQRFLGLRGRTPIIASYGFLLPDKGLTELILGFGLLKNSYPDALLLMVNSEYPNPISSREAAACRTLISDLGLDADVILITEFLENADAAMLLQAANVIVYPYQRTGESSSAAVRFGLACRRPVAVTPLPIFAEVAEITFALPGTAPSDISMGVSRLLDDETLREQLLQKQEDWLRETAWERVGERFANMVIGLHEDRHNVSVSSNPSQIRPSRRRSARRKISVDEDLRDLRTDAYVRILYQRVVGRPPDDEALRWVNDLNSGARSREDLIRALEHERVHCNQIGEGEPSPIEEHVVNLAHLDGTTDDVFVREIYRQLLWREPDDAGFSYYRSLLRDGSIDRCRFVKIIMDSEEFLSGNRPVRVLDRSAADFKAA